MSDAALNYYELLSVSMTATTEEIKAAYRAILLKHHPDRHLAQRTLDFDLLKTACTVLTSPTQRATYNASIIQSAHKTTPSPHRPAESVSLNMFSPQEDFFVYPCRCGNAFLLDFSDIDAGNHLLACPGCSETIRVDYEVVDE